MKKNLLICSVIISFLIFMAACGGQRESQQNLNTGNEYSSKTGDSTRNQMEESEDNYKINSEKTAIDHQDKTNKDSIDWSAITPNGVNEEMFISRLDEKVLEKVASELQALVQEEIEEERANPDILLTQGWTRVFNSAHYKNVIDIGDTAMMPLYWIIYKSPNSGMYEYICANALYELSGYDFSNEDGSLKWTTSKELLELFDEAVLNEE